VTRIDHLLRECRDGVPFKALGDVAVLRRGASITKHAATPGEIPVVAGGKTAAYYHNAPNRDGESIVVAGSGAYAGFVSWWTEPIFVSDAFTVAPSAGRVSPKYCFYWLQSVQANLHSLKSGGGVPHVYPRDVAKLRIPIPPMHVQTEIVRILDRFTEMKSELEAELEARRRQHAHYRESLLAFREARDVKWSPMGELGHIFRGKRFTKADYVDQGGVGCIHYGEIYTHYGTSAERTISQLRSGLAPTLRFATSGDVVLTDVGETVEDVGKAVAWLGSEDVAIHDHCYVFRSRMDPVFVSHYMQTARFRADKDRHIARTKVKTLLPDGVRRIPLPVPPLGEQRRIVDILDKFDALVNDLSIGLPAELAARRKQYEHYRDRLLTFEEAA
jgi:type I restriction enzyme S subunit